MNSPMWKTRSGKLISIKKMSDDHLRNAMAFVLGRTMLTWNIPVNKRCKEVLPEVYGDMEYELKGRGK